MLLTILDDVVFSCYHLLFLSAPFYPFLCVNTNIIHFLAAGKSPDVSSVPDSTSPDPDKPEGEIVVMQTNNTNGRSYDKVHYCPFCNKPFKLKLRRHLLTQHKDEPKVIEADSEKDPKIKDARFTYLRNLGNHLHNGEVIRSGVGRLIVAYRQSDSADWQDYVPCEFCLGYYAKREYWKHVQRCTAAPANSKKHGRLLESARMLLPVPAGRSDSLKKLLNTFSSDAVSRTVKSDELILQFAERLFMKHGHDHDQYPAVRNTLREVARLLVDLRTTTNNPSADLKQFIRPIKFSNVVNSALNVAGFDPSTNTMKTPSLALKIGHSIKKCAKIIKANGLQLGDDDSVRNASAFVELCEMEWTQSVSTHALRTLSEMKRNKVKLIPLTEDCVLLTNTLKKTAQEAYGKLLKKEDVKVSWAILNEVTLTTIILFNRRRQGEVSRMKRSDVKDVHQSLQDDIVRSLSPLEKKLCQVLHRIEIVGKRGRTVPILLTSTMMSWLTKLMETREEGGVNPANEYVFACSNYGSMGHLRGSDTLRDYSTSCGASHPELIRSTRLRKQIATLSQILNLKDNELDILANFLGHDIRVHREFYRLPEETLQVAKVSKLLMALENGTLHEQKGKSLSEITVKGDEGRKSYIMTHYYKVSMRMDGKTV